MTGTIRLVDWTDDSVIARARALDGTQWTRELGKEAEAALHARRSAIEGLALDVGDDKVYVSTPSYGDEFGGRLKDIRWRGEKAVLMAASWEKDAKDAEHTGDGTGADNYENADDSAIIQDAIDGVDGLSAGMIQTVETGLNYRFARVSRAKQLRTVESTGDGELRFNADGTVDYVDELGRDRSHVTFDETSVRLVDSLEVTRVGDDRKINKLVMLGSGEGPSQIERTLTASSFDSATDRAKWGARVNSEISDGDTLETFGQALVDELASDQVEVETAIHEGRLRLGDTYHVRSDRKDVDTDLRVAKLTTVLGNDGRTHRVVFSNRKQTRESLEDELVKDVRRAGRVIEGFTVPLGQSAGPGWVDSGRDFRFKVPYPSDVLQEVRLDLVVEGLRYMDPSGGSLSSQTEYPQDCDVKINGDSLGTSFGDGSSAFVEIVDLSGELTEGTTNTIDITSGNIGMIRCTFDGEIYREMV